MRATLARVIADNVADLVGEVDSTGRWRYANAEMSSRLGYSRDELLGRSLEDVVHPDDIGVTGRQVGEIPVPSGETAWIGEPISLRMRNSDGAYLSLSGSRHGLRSDTGEATTLFILREDRSREEAAPSGPVDRRLVHGLRNRIATIMSCTEWALSKLDAQSPVRESLEDILTSCSGAANLIRYSGGDEPDWAPDTSPSRSVEGREAVLIIDDDDLLSASQERLLAELGLGAVRASTGTEALEELVARADAVRAVLLDLHLPGMSGERVLEQIQRLRPELPVIVVTGYATRGIAERAASDPRVLLLHKPYEVARLLELLRSVLGE